MIGESRSSPDSGVMTVEQIEHQFAKLRDNEDGSPGLRASVVNLVVVTDEESADKVTEIVSGLAGNFPSRAIVLISDPDEERANLDFRVSAFCSIRGSGQVCAEQVTIHAEGPPAHHLESLAGPLLLPDLPVFLWYPGDFVANSPEFEGMISLADRLVVDPAASQDQGACLRELAGLLDRDDPPDLGDLQWVSLSPWRGLVAELFHPPDRAEKLGEIERVEILHAPRGEARALLLAGWLASTLGWIPESVSREGEDREVSFSGPSGQVTVEMSAGSPDSALQHIQLHAGDMSFQVSRHRQSSEARSTVMQDEEVVAERTVRLGSFEPDSILGEELHYRGRDDVYRAALKMAVEIMDL